MKTSSIYKAACSAILMALLVYLLPVVSTFDLSMIDVGRDGLLEVLIKSIAVAVITALCCVAIGFSCAYKMRQIEQYSKAARLLPLLLLPFLIGNVSTALIFKLLLLEGDTKSFLFNHSYLVFTVVIAIQIWQFGSLFTYLFWLSLKNIDEKRISYAEVFGLTRFETIRDIYLPEVKNLFILLFLLGFIFSVYENTKLTLIFSASPGTNTELISQWLYRQFQSDLLINYNFAAQSMSSISFGVLLPSIFLCFVLCSRIAFWFFKYLSNSGKENTEVRVLSTKSGANKTKRGTGKKLAIIIIFSIALPIAVTLVQHFNPKNINVAFLIEPLSLSFFAACFATALAVILAFVLRMSSIHKMAKFNRFSATVITLLYTLTLTPPIILLIASFQWLAALEISTQNSITLFWVLGHSILMLPLLSSFLLISHFRVSSRELEFLKVFKVSQGQTWILHFIKRFKGEYFLTLVLAITIVWNEGLINRVFSDHIPSFVSTITASIVGKSANYGNAMMFLLVSLTLSLSCIAMWVLSSQSKRERTSK